MMGSQVANRAAFVNEPVGMVMKGPCQKQEEKRKSQEQKALAGQKILPPQGLLKASILKASAGIELTFKLGNDFLLLGMNLLSAWKS